ncbi:MAG: ISAs1 family transposase [Anaerocolumna sp.]
MRIGKTLEECIGLIEDPRADYNKRHNFLDIMTVAILAVISGADTWDDIEDFGIAKKEWLASFLELPNGIPSHDTFNRIFSMIKPEQFHEAFIEWVKAITEKVEGVVAIDGKTVRRSLDDAKGKCAIHVVSAWAASNNLVLGQYKVDEKSNEITAIPELLKQLEIKGCIVTIDAMGTQTKIAETIVGCEADYILQVKENQPQLYEDISLYFREDVLSKSKKVLVEKGRYYKEYSGEHGRIEEREYYVEHKIDWMEQKKNWKGLQGIAMCHAKIEKQGKITESYSYAIFSREKMTAEEFGKSKRSHWKIENSLHWVLDIAYREDESRARNGNSAENLNILRHMTLNMLKQEKTSKRGIAGKRKNCGWNNEYLLKVLNTADAETVNQL